MSALPLDPTLLCREAEEWAARLTDKADACVRHKLIHTSLSRTNARTLASLLTQLSTLARAAGART